MLDRVLPTHGTSKTIPRQYDFKKLKSIEKHDFLHPVTSVVVGAL